MKAQDQENQENEKTEKQERNEKGGKTEKPKKHQNYEKSSTENIDVKNQKKLSNSSLEDVNENKIIILISHLFFLLSKTIDISHKMSPKSL